MTTTVISTIGTASRNYSTIQAWEDACPSNLVTDDKIWRGECYNDSEFVITTTLVTFGGCTVDSTHYLDITVAAGQSIFDNVANPLFYDQSKGVGIRTNTDYVGFFQNPAYPSNTLKISRFQTRQNASAHSGGGWYGGYFVRDCLVQGPGTGVNHIGMLVRGNSTIINVICVADTAFDGGGFDIAEASTAINCTAVCPTGSTGIQGFSIYSSNSFAYNCVSMGWTTAWDLGGSSPTIDRCASDQASCPGTNALSSLTFANQFVSTTNDFRLKAGSDLFGAGNTDAANAPNDIFGTARRLTTDGAIGASEPAVVTVTSTIGTSSRNYSTPQAWEDACPANLRTQNKIWQGECYNDSEFTEGLLIMDGHTEDATRYAHLTVAAGQSFCDNSSNPLAYDQSKGVGFLIDVSYSAIFVNNAYSKVSRLQIKKTSVVGLAITSSGGQGQAILKDCLIDTSTPDSAAVNMGTCINVIVISRASSGAVGFQIGNYNNTRHLNCTAVLVSSVSPNGTAFLRISGNPIINNCAAFGFTNGYSGGGTPTGNYNATDAASGMPGANSLHSLTYANQFISTTNDFRLKTGSDCFGAGNTDATNAPNDIFGNVRHATTTGAIGAHEPEILVVASSIGSGTGRYYSTLQAWEDACPANLRTQNKIWQGACYKDSEFTSASTLLTISGETTDAARYLHLTAPGTQTGAATQTSVIGRGGSSYQKDATSMGWNWTVGGGSDSCEQLIAALKPAGANVAFNAGASTQLGSSGTTTTLSLTIGAGSNQFLVVGVGLHGGSLSVTSVDWNGTALKRVLTSGGGAHMYTLKAPAQGTYTLTIVHESARPHVHASAYNNVDQTTPVSATAIHYDAFTAPPFLKGIAVLPGGMAVDFIITDNSNALTADVSQSFADSTANALDYNASNGVAMRTTVGYNDVVSNGVAYTKLTRLQIRSDSDSIHGIYSPGSGTNLTVDGCLLTSLGSSVNSLGLVRAGVNTKIRNTLLKTAGLTAVFNDSQSGNEFLNCTFVATGGTGTVASVDQYTVTYPKWTNCAVFGFTNIRGGNNSGINASSNYNATDLSAPSNWGANSLASKTFANQFINTSTDFRIKAGADLINAGNTDATNAPNDIFGTLRGVGVLGDIGAFEYVAAGGGFFSPYFYRQYIAGDQSNV